MSELNRLKEILGKSVNESKDAREYDYEGEMAKNDLHIITMHAEKIAELLDDNTNMPEWVQSKLTLAKDYMQTISDYLCAEMKEGVDEACWKGYTQVGMKMKGGKKVPNCVPGKGVPKQVKEENIQEVSKSTMSSYMMKASDKNVKDAVDLVKKGRDMSNSEYSDADRKIKKRDSSIKKVISKLNKPVQESSDYMRRRQKEEDIISGKKPARKRIPKGNDYFQRRKKQDENI
jgi:hypothetical protein